MGIVVDGFVLAAWTFGGVATVLGDILSVVFRWFGKSDNALSRLSRPLISPLLANVDSAESNVMMIIDL